MSVDSKQFNRTVLSHEEVEQLIRRAHRLRSEAIAQGARQLALTLGAGARRLGTLIGGALHANAKNGGGAACATWVPATATAGRPVRCK